VAKTRKYTDLALFQYTDWPALIPVSVPGSTNIQQMASSLGKERGRGRKKAQSENEGAKALVLDMSQRLSPSYI